MFFTKEFQRNPISAILGNKDATYWTSFELALMTPWFVILIKQPVWDGESPISDDAATVYRTIVTGDIRDALSLISNQHQSEVTVHSVSLVFPNRDEENASWEMKKITAAWTSDKEAPDNELISATVNYVETDDGQLYPMFYQPKAPKTKEGYRMMCAFPNGVGANAL